MKRLKIPTLAIALAAYCASPVDAQVTLDVAKITCKQFRGYEITNPNNIAIWLSGYYHGKKGSTILDVEELKSVKDKVSDYCIMNPTVTVMQAAQAVVTPAAR